MGRTASDVMDIKREVELHQRWIFKRQGRAADLSFRDLSGLKLTGIKPASENNVNISALNGGFGRLFSTERLWLKNVDFPFGVSIVIVAKKK